MRLPFAAALALLLASPGRAADCSMTGNTDCVSAANPERKAACVSALDAVREACNAKADEAQAKMQELGSTTNKAAKPEMADYLVALNTLYEISRAAQQLSYTDPKGVDLLKAVNVDTGQQQYNMNRTFEIVVKKEKQIEAKLKEELKKAGKKTDKPTDSKGNARRNGTPRPPKVSPDDSGSSSGSSSGGSDGGNDDGGGAATAAEANDEAAGAASDAAAAQRAQAGGAKAMGSARSLGDALKRDLNVDGGAAPGAGAGKSSPKTEKDLLLSAVSGYDGSLTALGLKTGKDASGAPTILRMDGSPATEADLAALKARISGEPTALMRRPDFYSAIARQRFMELKNDYRGRPDLRDGAFRHVALSESERDFQRSASCSTLSGPCAPHAKTASYKKGEDVPPEELARIHRAIHDEPEGDFIDAGPESGFDGPPDESNAASAGPAAGEPPPPAPSGGIRDMLARLETMLVLQPAAEAGTPAGSPAARRPGSSSVPGLDAARALGARLPPGRYLAGAALFAAALLLLLRRRPT